MSIIKSIKLVLGLGAATENHFWDGSIPNQLLLRRGTPEAPGTEVLKVVDGVLEPVQTGPAFSAYKSLADTNQVLSSGVNTKVTFPTENFNIDNCFASSRFQPTVAGYYKADAQVRYNATTVGLALQTTLVKNGAGSVAFFMGQTSATLGISTTVSALVYLNGTTDYLEVFSQQSSGANLAILANDNQQVQFSAFLARKA